ncbi:MAG: DUF4339 domain-containing protein [Planctomycetaceae bacterium]
MKPPRQHQQALMGRSAMSKEWFYQLMGTEFGPIASIELRKKAQRGEIAPDTPVRMASSDRWIDASAVKGLFDPPEPPPSVKVSPLLSAHETIRSAPTSKSSADAKPMPDNFEKVFSVPTTTDEDLEHHDANDEYEFFRFVGFRQAISEKLFAEVETYRLKHSMTMTQMTRRALAELIGKPELAVDRPNEPPEESPADNDVTATGDIESDTASQ